MLLWLSTACQVATQGFEQRGPDAAIAEPVFRTERCARLIGPVHQSSLSLQREYALRSVPGDNEGYLYQPRTLG